MLDAERNDGKVMGQGFFLGTIVLAIVLIITAYTVNLYNIGETCRRNGYSNTSHINRKWYCINTDRGMEISPHETVKLTELCNDN